MERAQEEETLGAGLHEAMMKAVTTGVAQEFANFEVAEKFYFNFAACRNKDKTLFQPEDMRAERAAIAICDTCIVKPECREYGLKYPNPHVILGGLNQKQRIAERRRRAELQIVSDADSSVA